MSLSVPSFSPFLANSLHAHHLISPDLIPVETAQSTPTTELRPYALKQVHAKGLTRFSPRNRFFKIFFLMSEKLEPNGNPPLPSPRTDTLLVTEDDDVQCQAKPVPTPVNPPMTDPSVALRSAPSSFSRPPSIQSILGTGCETSNPLHSPVMASFSLSPFFTLSSESRT
jgi:hypothetical protein